MGYVVWMPVQQKGSWLGEGDDFTFMDMLGNGLRAFEKGSYGGWGGREVGEQRFSFQLSDTSQQAMASALGTVNSQENKIAYPDFFPAAQNDFAARLKWSVTPKYADANHAPVISIEGPLDVLASPGNTIRLNAKVSDPDGNEVSVKWWQFQTGTYPGKVEILNANGAKAQLVIPKDAVAGQTIHLVAEATDNGTPMLVSYQRVVVTVRK
jgi:hypothetical protein